MKGLILKDLLNLKKQLGVYLLLVVMYLAIAVMSKDGSFLMGVITVLFAMIPITALSYDERAGWDKYAVSMFIPRKNLVLSKYVLGLCASVMGILVSFFYAMFYGMPMYEGLFSCAALFIIAILWISFLLPLMFKFGTEKGRILMIVGLFVPVLIFSLIGKLNIASADLSFIKAAVYLIPVVVIALLVLSYLLSLAVYSKKEF